MLRLRSATVLRLSSATEASITPWL